MNTRLHLGLAALLTTLLIACGGTPPTLDSVTPDTAGTADGLLTAQDIKGDHDDEDEKDENSGHGLQMPGIDPKSPLGLPRLIGIKPRLQPDAQVMSDRLAASITSLQVLNGKECAANLTPREACQFLFKLPGLPARIRPGSVLVAGVTSATPNGLLVRVRSVKGTTVQASEASLGEALKEGEFQLERTFTPNQIQAQNLLAGVTVVTQSAAPAAARNRNDQNLRAQALGFHLAIDHVQLAPGVHADGSIDFNAACGAYGGLTWRRVAGVPVYPNGVSFDAKCGVEQSAQLKLTAGAGLSISNEVSLGSITLQPIVFAVGPLPVVLVPKISLSVSASGRVSANMTFSAAEHFTARVGIRYSSGFEPYKEFSAGASSELGRLQASVDARASANLKQSLLLYGVVGPQMTESAYLKFKGDINSTPTWCLTAGLSADVSLHIDLHVKTLDYGPANLFDSTLASHCESNTAPTVRITGPAANATLYRGLPSFFSSEADDAQDVGSLLPVTWTSNRDGPLGTGTNLNAVHAALRTLGVHTITATVTDSGGAQGTATVQVNVVDPQPTVTLTARDANGNVRTNPTSMQQGDILYLSASIAYPDVNPLPCSALTWNGGGLTVAPDGTCLLPVTLSRQGTFTITATATDTLGNSGTASYQVNVGPPPVTVTPQFDVIRARVISAAHTAPHGLIEGDTFETFDRLQFDMAYLNAAQTHLNVRYEWSYRRATDAAWTPLPATTTPDTNTTSARFFGLDVYDATYEYTFQVQIIDAGSGALLGTRVIHLTYRGWVS